MRKKQVFGLLISLAVFGVFFAGIQRLVVPKYMGMVVEGNFTQEYYREESSHDVLFLGNCEVYENISPITLWEEYGITSYIRGNAQQLIAQSYYLLEDTLRYETPKVVVFSILSMKQAAQTNESYNRMTLDGMRWSSSKWKAIMATKMEGEHGIEYVFPLLRFHSRWKDLEEEDFRYYWSREDVSHSGYYLRADVRPAGEFPQERRIADYSFAPEAWEYLDKIRLLCEEKGIQFVLMKAPSLYPAWHEQWDAQIVDYASRYGLCYVNGIEKMQEIGIDFSKDTYDQGLHMNVYGAEKMAHYLGGILAEMPGVEDRRAEEELARIWEEKSERYRQEKKEQEEEFARLGYLTQFYQEQAEGKQK